MLFESWQIHLVRVIPESIVLVALGTALVKEKFSLKQIASAGLIIGVIGLMLQRMKMKYGVQIPVGLAVFIIVMLLIFKLNVLKSAAAALLSFIVLSFVEALSFFVLTKVTNYPEDIMIRGTDFERLILMSKPA